MCRSTALALAVIFRRPEYLGFVTLKTFGDGNCFGNLEVDVKNEFYNTGDGHMLLVDVGLFMNFVNCF